MSDRWSVIRHIIKIILTVLVANCCPAALLFAFAAALEGEIFILLGTLLVPGLIPLIWMKKKKVYLLGFCGVFVVSAVGFGIQTGLQLYEESVTVDVTPNIDLSEYLPFKEDSKIVKYRSQTLRLTHRLPVIDGAAATFPVYSAFVNAVYPSTTTLHDASFKYNNTVTGYELLAEKETDIFIGAKPSQEQVDYAEECGTTFAYTQIGSEAFVFFVHKDNPIESLTTEQIRKIYSGEITNWNEVGGADEEIAAFQRNEGSGSQSMMLRFMGDTPLMEAETKEIQTMGGIIYEVADYKNKKGSIGFSFRFYIEGIVQNPDIKMIAVDGVSPTVENIKNGTYPIITPLYAVTYEDNPNENVDTLIEWMLSDEGQRIVEETGYAGVAR